MNSPKILGSITSADLKTLATTPIHKSVSVQNILNNLILKTKLKQDDTVPMKSDENEMGFQHLFPKSWGTSLSECEEAFDRYICPVADPLYETRYEAKLRKRYPTIPIRPMDPMTENASTEKNYLTKKDEQETGPISSCFSCFPIWEDLDWSWSSWRQTGI